MATLEELESRVTALESRMAAIERSVDGIGALVQKEIASYMEVQFPVLFKDMFKAWWKESKEEDEEHDRERRLAERKKFIRDIQKAVGYPFRFSQYVFPLLQVIMALIIILTFLNAVLD